MKHEKYDVHYYQYIKDSFLAAEIDINDKQIEQLLKYYEMLIETNKVMNLTAIIDFEDVVIKHFIDSLMISKYIDLRNYKSLIDVGTGAGFPGIPLKIVYPHLNVCLMDSLNKRIGFLNNVIIELGLKNTKAVHERAEILGHYDNYRERYDICVSRAVADLSVLSEYAIPFVKTEGYFIPYKSGDIEQELNNAGNALNELSSKIERKVEFVLPQTDFKRSIIFIKKEKKTSNKYPRKPGVPKKSPL